ncbi:hypothetical protein HOY81_09650 [Streptomyces sp. JJ36]|nr:hypothetical protein [Streptomyces sp. JJ36]
MLDRVTTSALAWLDAHAAGFRLPGDPTGAGCDPDATLKPLGELARLSGTLATLPGLTRETHRAARRLLHHAWREAGHGALFVALARAEPHATYPLEVYAPFAEAGLRHRPYEELARAHAGTRAWRAAELEPTRLLAVLQAERCLGLPPHELPEQAMRRTWLGALPEPWAFEGGSGYALTHYVFHATGWGRRPRELPDGVRDHLALWLPAWTDCCLAEERWDLAGELLATAACLPDPLPAAAEWRRLAAAQGADGALAEAGPPPAAGPGAGEPAAGEPSTGVSAAGESPAGATRAAFLGCYHATLVAAFAAGLTAARTRCLPGAAAVTE